MPPGTHLEAECDRKDYVNEKFQWDQPESNQRLIKNYVTEKSEKKITAWFQNNDSISYVYNSWNVMVCEWST